MRCAKCGLEPRTLTENENHAYVCPTCLAVALPKVHKTYNRKGFLVPDSIVSMSCFHAKVFTDGTYIFRIHDCNTGIRFKGDLNSIDQVREAVEKAKALEDALREFRLFVEQRYDVDINTTFP